MRCDKAKYLNSYHVEVWKFRKIRVGPDIYWTHGLLSYDINVAVSLDHKWRKNKCRIGESNQNIVSLNGINLTPWHSRLVLEWFKTYHTPVWASYNRGKRRGLQSALIRVITNLIRILKENWRPGETQI